MEVVLAVLSCLLLSCTALTLSPTEYPFRTERDLRRDLFRDYDKLSRPVKDTKTQMNLLAQMTPLMIRAVDEKEQTIVVDTWMKMKWHDDYLTWDPKAYNNITVLRLSNSEVWKPDLSLYTAVDPDSMFPNSGTNVLIYSSGEVLWVPAFTVKSRCPMFNKNPKNNLECTIKFGSWTYDGYKLDLNLYDPEADISDFLDINRDWKLSSIKSSRENKFYPCCAEPYPSLLFNVTLKRRPSSMVKSNEYFSIEH